MEKLYKPYKKVYVLDTNILLTDAEFIHTLSDDSTNLIVLPEIVLDEIDSKKSGFDEINFQARKFARILSEDSTIIESSKNGNTRVLVQLKTGEVVEIIGKDNYDTKTKDTAPNIINDRKIIEIAEDTKKIYSKYGLNTILLSNDIMMRTRAISKQLDTEFITDKQTKINFEFYKEYSLNEDIKDGTPLSKIEELIGEEIPSNIWSFKFINEITGKPIYAYRDNNYITHIDETKLSRQMANPKNTEQRFLSSLILSEHVDIVVVNGNAGTGKNYVATSSAMRLMDTRRDLYSSILYIRKTVVSDDKQGEVGFLPGTLEEKMSGYLAPLYNTLENFVKSKYKDKKTELTNEAIETEVEELIKKYAIDTKYLGHLRGSTISNAIVIIDEVQNMTLLDLQTTLSRVGKDVKVIIMGSQKQIDNPYLNQYNNALTYIDSKIGDPKNNDLEVKLAGCELKKAVRSKIAEWTDIVF